MSSLAAGLDDKNVGDIEEEFEFLERLGAGTYGEVWKACHKKSNKLLAIKKIRVDRDTTDLLREISIMKKCVSPWVVRYYGNYFKDDVMWIIMEYCSVGSVNDLMCITKKTLNEEQIAAVCRPTAQGLDFMAKNNKIHRDIKPHNILLNSKGEAKLADFGISRDMSDSGTKRKTVIGTPFYLAPEVIKETGYDTKADIWALGITAIEMAEKNPPYHDLHSMRVLFLIANNPPPTLTHPEHWSEEFNDFIAQCLKKEPNERPSAEELLSHPFLKKGAEEHLVTLIEDGERIIREHGGFELTMKAIASANADDSDDDTISLDGLNEGMGELSDPASSGDSFGLFDLPIASAKFNDDDSDDHSDYEVPVSPRVSAPKESPVPASPTPNIVLTPSTPLRKAQAAIMLTPTNRRSAELRVSDQGSKRRNSIDWSGLMEPGSQGTPDNKRKARRASVTIRTNDTLRPALNRVDSQNKSNREINSLLAELDAIDRPTSPSNSRDNLLPTNTGSDAVTKRRSFTTASAASTSFVRNNPSYQVHQQLGVWRGKVAAKNPFRNNPQWVVTVNRPCQLCIAVKSDRAQLNIGFYVLLLRDIQHRLAVLPSYGLHSEFPPVRAPEVSSQLQFQDANMKYVIVPYAEQLPLGEEITYDLFMLTPSPDVKLSIKPVPDMEEIAIQGEWKGDTAGGCINFSSWRNNPQYYLHIKRAVDLYIFLTQNDSLLTHIGLYCIKVPAPPQRKVLFFERESLVTRDSKFHKKTEITPGKLALEPGHYILMPTTYAPGTTARFTLSVLAAYKAEGNNNATRSFMLSKVKPWEHSTISGAWTSDTAGGCMNNTSWINNPKFHFNLVTKNELTIVLHRDESASKSSTNGVQSERPFIGFYLFKAELGEAGTLSRDKLMHKTKNFLDLKEVSMSGLSLERGSYLIVPCTYNAGYQGAFGVTVYTDLDIIALNPVREQATLIKGAWSHVQCTAGGCINFPTWRSNAQYYLELEEVDDEDVTIDLVLEQEPHNNNVTVMSPQTGGTTKAQLPHIGFLVVKAPLQLQDKLMQLTSKDVIASAEYLNDYRVSKRMTINTGEWRSFVIIPTTFYPKEENSFTLRVIGPHITKLTRVSSNWVERAHEAAWSKSNNTCGGCMNNPTWLQNPKLIVFSQKTARYFLCLTQHLKPHQNPKTDLLAVGFYVFRKAEDAKLTFTKPNLVGKSEFSLSKDVLLELNLPAGTYIIIPAIFQAGKEANFSFTVYGSDDFGLTAL